MWLIATLCWQQPKSDRPRAHLSCGGCMHMAHGHHWSDLPGRPLCCSEYISQCNAAMLTTLVQQPGLLCSHRPAHWHTHCALGMAAQQGISRCCSLDKLQLQQGWQMVRVGNASFCLKYIPPGQYWASTAHRLQAEDSLLHKGGGVMRDMIQSRGA